MKKILITLFFIAGTLFGQEFGDGAFYGYVTNPLSQSTIQLRHAGKTKVMTWSVLNSLLDTGSDLLEQQNTWTANQIFTAKFETIKGNCRAVPCARRIVN